MDRVAPMTAGESLPTAFKKHILFDLNAIDQRTEEIEERSERCYKSLSRLIAGKAQKDRLEIYTKYIAANPQALLDELIIGLTVALLIVEDQPEANNKVLEYYQDITAISKDNLVCLSTFVNLLIVERITKLTSIAVKRIFWLTNQLTKANAVQAELVYSNLVRQTAKGDLTARNLFLADNLVMLCIDTRSWLVDSTKFMGPTIIYNIMRLINDHAAAAHKPLRQKEIDFVIGLIREKFDIVMQIGRDFLRLLQYLLSAKIPEFQQLYQDIYHNDPKLLHPNFEGPQQLLVTRTARRLFQTCLTYEMEKNISFIATQVKFGNQKRYQEWFAKNYFSGHDPNSLLRCDIIRYICTIIHPSNEVLCSDIMPRWAIIGWLLTTNHHVMQSCRLTLFFDWLSYEPRTDNIMNIEPGILLMAHSVRSHPQVTSNLLDFLCRAHNMFPPKISALVRTGIKRSLQQVLEKRVIQSLTPVFLNPKFDPNLKQLVKESFPEYCQVENEPQALHAAPNQRQHPPTNAPPVAAPTLPLPAATPGLVNASVKQPQRQNSLNTNNSKPPQVVILDENSLEIQPPFTTTLQKPAGNMEAAKVNQDANHIARGDHTVVTDKCESIKKSKQTLRPPVIKTAGRLEGDQEVEILEITKPNDQQVASKSKPIVPKVESPTLELPVGGSYNFGSAQDELVLDSRHGHPIANNIDGSSSNNTNHFYDLMQNDLNILTPDDIENSTTRVMYPFMIIKTETCRVAKHLIEPFEDMLDECQNSDSSSCEDRCSLMSKLLSILSEKLPQLGTKDSNELNIYLGNRLVQTLADDFTTRILASPTHDHAELERSITKPLFILCREVFQDQKPNPLLIKLLVTITKLYQATSFLVLYFMRARYCIWGAPSCPHYIEYCEACGRDLNEALEGDLDMMCTYDPEMFCFTLPSIYSEYAASGRFNITNNTRLIRKSVSALDSVTMQELMCCCLTGTCKVFNRDNPREVIEASLEWETWEQFSFWKLLTAQSVPLENYISVLPTLDAKVHPEALSAIMLTLQRCDDPSTIILRHLITAHSKQNEHFVSSIIRHWALRGDVKELTEKLTSLIDARSSSQVKRKGPASRAHNKPPSLSMNDEKILKILDHIRLKAPRSRLFHQSEIFEGLADIESVCDDGQKRQFAEMFAYRPIATNKKKKLDRDATT